MPDNPEGSAQAGTDVAAELAAAREEIRKQREKLDMASNLASNKTREAENYKRQLQEAQTRREVEAARQNPDDENAMFTRISQRQALINERMGLMQFKQDHPEVKDMTEILQMFQDPNQPNLRVFDGELPDYHASLNNAYNALKGRRYDEMIAAADAEKATQREETNRQKAQATISGVSGSVGQETINVDDMSSDEMIAKGLVEMDPRDPVRPRIKPMVRTG